MWIIYCRQSRNAEHKCKSHRLPVPESPGYPKLKTSKVICTLGPATDNKDIIHNLLMAGMDVARINGSHGDRQQHLRIAQMVRDAATEAQLPIAIMFDLQGPKIRVGKLPPNGVALKKDAQLLIYPLSMEPQADTSHLLTIPISYPRLLEDIDPGREILLDDGRLRLIVEEKLDTGLLCRVIDGGLLTSHKGANFPYSSLRVPSITEKDKYDLETALMAGADYIALSFVRQASDITSLRSLIAEITSSATSTPSNETRDATTTHINQTSQPAIIAKIERPEGVANLDTIIDEADGIMVARGDLGVEMAVYRVPAIQVQAIHKVNSKAKLVIIATQMLESMIKSPSPTRAEVNDVAVAVMEGADAVMLSGETAVGDYPLEAVRIMVKTVNAARTIISTLADPRKAFLPSLDPISSATSGSAVRMAEEIDAKLIACYTRSGSTARFASNYRPSVPILALTDNEATYRKMAMMWGVHPCLIGHWFSMEEMFREAERQALENKMCTHGDLMVITMGYPPGPNAGTNLLTVRAVGITGRAPTEP